MSNKLVGNQAEQFVYQLLVKQGFMGEIIQTKMRLARIRGRVVQVPDKGTKLGDIIGVWCARATLIEVKDHNEELFQYSVLKRHQHAALKKWKEKEGTSYIGWIRGGALCLIDYPLDWLPRASLSWRDYAQFPG